MEALFGAHESSGGAGVPTVTLRRQLPTIFAPWAGGFPTVRRLVTWVGEEHDGNASGGPCVAVRRGACL